MAQILIILGVLFILFNLVCFVVSQQTIAIVERFGRFTKLAHPGLNFKIPFIDNIAGFVNLKIRELTLLVETKTLDNVFVKLVVSVQYKAIEDKCFDAFYKLENHTAQIQSFVFDAIRAKVPAILLDDVFSKKDEIAVDVKRELHDTMIDFGYEIIKTLVTDIQPDEHVKNAMNEINTAQRLRMAATQKAEAEKIMRVKQAEAESESNILHGIGIAGQRKAIIDGLGRSVEELQKNTPELRSEKIMQMIMLIQYFDMMRDIGGNSKSNAVFLSHLPGNISELAKQLQEIIPTTSKEV
ncbi:membrane protease subunit, stomatin/prohibitin [Candidatus Phycorickettsia trachydisci]|uniref:Membrane protease subunit, stomatin/prohibitin n=1 Tax=Candidatus Phycorickettsia trachydisci TaxID=2115978 RepID=A0A2P1P837_9RICK|nr:SPFH domain-containing protein [Candidatus Phycorickettsia trachydisci]AVP87432.1 membrane protease subunit, stomatin/prohibitin [Candidatus Phycorickettsia trachydisci]